MDLEVSQEERWVRPERALCFRFFCPRTLCTPQNIGGIKQQLAKIDDVNTLIGKISPKRLTVYYNISACLNERKEKRGGQGQNIEGTSLLYVIVAALV